ncbi:hypothetical protein [Staphylococcus epidermidis]|uniref:hypothetical protein n=1 Tax=Staphylococcus epidermidis TaxID=1282 RepID=UPI00138E4585
MIDVKKALEKAKAMDKGMSCFGVLGSEERYEVEHALDELDVSYETTAVSGEYDVRPYDIYADVNTYQSTSVAQ